MQDRRSDGERVGGRAHTVVAGPSGPAHAARPSTRLGGRPSPTALLAAAVLLALLATAAVRLAGSVGDTTSTATSARLITAAPRIPLSAAELVELTLRPAEVGALSDPGRRAYCLTAIGRPATARVLGGRDVQLAGRTATVLVLPGERPGELVAVAVDADCGNRRGKIIAESTVPGPGNAPAHAPAEVPVTGAPGNTPS